MFRQILFIFVNYAKILCKQHYVNYATSPKKGPLDFNGIKQHLGYLLFVLTTSWLSGYRYVNSLGDYSWLSSLLPAFSDCGSSL